jgi:CheY-like chemotaxis protein
MLEVPQPLATRCARYVRSLQILVVEDEDDTRELITDVLGRYGADSASDCFGLRACELLETWRPDVLISDMPCPIDGYSFMRVCALCRRAGR